MADDRAAVGQSVEKDHITPVEERELRAAFELHPSHRWGERPIFERVSPGSNRLRERKIPCCLTCLVDGFEDEHDAFQPCRRVAIRPGQPGAQA